MAGRSVYRPFCCGVNRGPRANSLAAALLRGQSPASQPHPLSLEQAAAMLCAADDLVPGRQRRGPYEVAPHRDRLLVHLLLDGLRPRQAVGMVLEDLHEEEPHRRVRTLTCPAPKGDGAIVHQPAREVWQAIADYLPHRVDGQDPPPDGARYSPVLLSGTRGGRLCSGAFTATP